MLRKIWQSRDHYKSTIRCSRLPNSFILHHSLSSLSSMALLTSSPHFHPPCPETNQAEPSVEPIATIPWVSQSSPCPWIHIRNRTLSSIPISSSAPTTLLLFGHPTFRPRSLPFHSLNLHPKCVVQLAALSAPSCAVLPAALSAPSCAVPLAARSAPSCAVLPEARNAPSCAGLPAVRSARSCKSLRDSQ